MDTLFSGSLIAPLLCATCDVLKDKMPTFKKKKGKIAENVIVLQNDLWFPLREAIKKVAADFEKQEATLAQQIKPVSLENKTLIEGYISDVLENQMFVKQSEPESTAFEYEFALERMLALSKTKGNDAVT